MSKHLLTALALAATAIAAQASPIATFNFNSAVPDANTGTGTTAPSFGAGSTTLAGGVASSFSSGTSNGGSSDPAPAGDNSGLQTTGYAAQGTANKSAGVFFAVSTVGFTGISVGYDLRHSNTSSRYETVQYTIDGSSFIDVAVFDGNAGDTWFNSRTVDLSSFAGVANNANFGFRVVASFAPSTNAYAASNSSSSYASTGTWRFDMANVTGTVAAVPEPDAIAMALAGFMALGVVARRRRRN